MNEAGFSLGDSRGGGQDLGIDSMTDVGTFGSSGRVQPARRSSRSVAKPNFRALENGGAETEELLDELGIVGDDVGESMGYSGQQGRKKRGSGRKGGVHGGLSKGGRVRKPAMLEDMEIIVSKLEDEVASLQEEAGVLTEMYQSLRAENTAMRNHMISSETTR
ncbi:hypothetical protein M9434_002548 [Picochlorum sp. BPE23]|nr:hypothetical protein M9434_002548 [Picochlorum sp. BPE23]